MCSFLNFCVQYINVISAAKYFYDFLISKLNFCHLICQMCVYTWRVQWIFFSVFILIMSPSEKALSYSLLSYQNTGEKICTYVHSSEDLHTLYPYESTLMCVHSGEKPYTCDQCNQSFFNVWWLNTTHVCSYCYKAIKWDQWSRECSLVTRHYTYMLIFEKTWMYLINFSKVFIQSTRFSGQVRSHMNMFDVSKYF